MSTTRTRTARPTRPAHSLKGGDVIAGVGEVFDSGPHADSRFVTVRIMGRRGVESLALLADAEIEVAGL